MLALDIKSSIQLWLIHLDTTTNLTKHLTDAEKNQFSRIRIPQHQHRMIAARAMLRRCLSDYLGEKNTAQKVDIEFIYGQYGKPYCKDYPDLFFNMSHSGSYALIAINRHHEIGLDIEQQRHLPELESIAKRVFSNEELTWLFSHEKEHQETIFFTLWTRKEAVIKTTGEGLNASLTRITTTDANGKICHPISYLENDGFILKDLEVPKNYKGAIVLMDPSESKDPSRISAI